MLGLKTLVYIKKSPLMMIPQKTLCTNIEACLIFYISCMTSDPNCSGTSWAIIDFFCASLNYYRGVAIYSYVLGKVSEYWRTGEGAHLNIPYALLIHVLLVMFKPSIQRGNCCLWFFSTFGEMGIAAYSTTAYKRLASLLAAQRNQDYGSVVPWIRCYTSFSLLRSAVTCFSTWSEVKRSFKYTTIDSYIKRTSDHILSTASRPGAHIYRYDREDTILCHKVDAPTSKSTT